MEKIKAFAERIPTAIKHNKIARNCLLSLRIGTLGAAAITSNQGVEAVQKLADEVIIPAAKRHILSWDEAARITGKAQRTNTLAKINMLKSERLLRLSKQKAAVIRIMDEDKHCVIDEKKKIADYIVSSANEFNIDPIQLACIAKKESHFEHITGYSGQGIMQITKTAVDNIYQFPENYHPKFADIAEQYPTSKLLYAELKRKPLMNIRIGALIFNNRLDSANGNVSKALKKYNGSPSKEKYAKIVSNDIKKYS